MCRNKRKQPTPLDDNVEGALFQSLCPISSTQNKPDHTKSSIILDHHLFDQQSGTWKRKSSKPQPFLGVSISIHKEDYKQLGFNSKLSTHTKELYTSALADTGCQSCLVGMNIIFKFGLKHDHLIPVTMKMHTANDNRINILGAIILRISGTSKSGKRVE